LAPRKMENKTQRQKIEPSRIKRILVYGANWVGDALMTTPALSCARKAFPEASISVLAVPRVEGIYRDHPSLDHTILYERSGRHRGTTGKRRLVRELRSFRFDMALLFPNSFQSALVPFLARIPVRVGYQADGRAALLTHGIERDKKVTERHQVAYYLGLLQTLGCRVGERRLSIPMREEVTALKLLASMGWREGRPLVAFAPGASFGTAKKWDSSRYAQVADAVMRDDSAQVLIIGSRSDRREAEDMVSRMQKKPWDLTGATTVGQVAALLGHCRLLITNDSGAMHLATAAKTPILALFGPTDPEKTSPYGVRHRILRHPVSCSPCLLRECPTDHRCMRGIEVNEVLEAVSAFLRKDSPRERKIAVFLDRDGTINEEVGYLSREEDLKLIPGAAEGLCLLNQHALKTVVVSNQSGVARGYLSLDQVREIHQRLEDLLEEKGAYLDGIYFCPHHPEIGEPPYRALCDCRKPQDGMLRTAARDLDLDLSSSYVIGDHLSDVVLGKRMGMKSILVLTGHGREQMDKLPSPEGLYPDFVAHGLNQAVRWILRDLEED
jgi:heptosyltransferase II